MAAEWERLLALVLEDALGRGIRLGLHGVKAVALPVQLRVEDVVAW